MKLGVRDLLAYLENRWHHVGYEPTLPNQALINSEDLNHGGGGGNKRRENRQHLHGRYLYNSSGIIIVTVNMMAVGAKNGHGGHHTSKGAAPFFPIPPRPQILKYFESEK